jgi:hypothetical protein
MQLKGVVRLVNDDDAVVAVETEHGGFTVFGLLGDYEVALGDEISGPLESMDQQLFTNETRAVAMLVYVEDVELSLEMARERVA